MKHIAVILKGYPRLSETFIAEEIHALENAGMTVTIFSLRHPTDRDTHPVHRAIRARVVYLPEYLYREPSRVLRAWWKTRRHHGYPHAWRIWRRDFWRECNANRARRFGQALVLAAELPDDIAMLYAHFLHTPASVARYAGTVMQLPWSCSAHAKDIWTLADWEKKEKLADCKWLTTCTHANFVHLREVADDPRKVALNYHGLPLEKFRADPPPPSDRDGGDPSQPVRILSVGRAVAKKGYRGLLDALAALPNNLHWRLTHIGGGEQLTECKQHSAALGIAANINWCGAQSQESVLNHYRHADFFALNCRITADGDRDGLPNVLVEAQGKALAVVSTRISGIPELVEHDVNGLLVAPDDGGELQDALARLITEPDLRQRLGGAGRDIVFNKFSMAENFKQLYRLFER